MRSVSRARPPLPVIAALILALSVSSPAVGQIGTANEAEVHFAIGTARYRAGDYQVALMHFLASNRLVSNRNVMFNIGATYEQLKDTPSAYLYYSKSLEGETRESVRRLVSDAIQRVTPSVALLSVATNPPGAAVYIDRRDLGTRGTTPLTLGMREGTVQVIVELAGYESAAARTAVLRVGSETAVGINLVQIVGTLQIEGEPVGAVVHRDLESGPELCRIPCTLQLAPGKPTLVLTSPRHETETIRTEVKAHARTTVRARLAWVQGELRVRADVPGAEVRVDGQVMGVSPLATAVPAGLRVVSVAAPGYRRLERRVVVPVRGRAELDLQMSELDEVSSASRSAERAEDAPGSVTVIPRKELRAMGYPTVVEALRGVRGLVVSDDRSYATVGVRGFNRPGDYTNRVLVLVDGMPTNEDYSSGALTSYEARTDIDDIEAIEIVRGPGSVLYGTSAFLAVINLVTRSRDEHTHGEVAVSTAEYGVMRARTTAYARLGERSGAWVSVSGAKGGGRDFYFPEYVADPGDPEAELGGNGLPVDGNARGLDGIRSGTVTGQAWHGDFSLQWLLTAREKRVPTAAYEAVFGDGRNVLRDQSGFAELRYEPRFEGCHLVSRAHVSMYNFSDVIPYPAPDGEFKDTYRGRWGGFEQRLIVTALRPLQLTVGGEVVRHFTTRQEAQSDLGPELFDDAGNSGRDDPFTVAAGYGVVDWDIARRVKASLGARIDHHSNLENAGIASLINPRLSLVIRPYDGGNIKLVGGKAFRAPSIYELNYVSAYQDKARGLTPEQIYSSEIELTHRFDPVWSLTTSLFANYVTRLVELGTATSGNLQYRNASAPVLLGGVELEVARAWRHGWVLSANVSRQEAQYVGDHALREVPNSPAYQGSLKAAAPVVPRAITAMSRLTVIGPVADRYDLPTDPPQHRTGEAVVWDLVFSGELGSPNTQYALGVYNVADWRYGAVVSGEFRQRTIAQNGRTLVASLSASF